jgi:CubicO group peptidase (beta-lactamase class C family)
VPYFILIFLLLAALSPALGQGDQGSYRDPNGLYTAPIPTGWKAESKEGYALLTDPEGGIRVYLLALEGSDPDEALAAGWRRVDPGFALAAADRIQPPSRGGVERTVQVAYKTPPERTVIGLAQLYRGRVYLVLVDARTEAVARRGSQINIIASGLRIAQLEEADLRAASPRPFDSALGAALEGYVRQAMTQAGVPGAVVAVVQGGQVVFQRAFGVRELGKEAPVTLDTQFMIGSAGKSLTTLLMATLVDAGKMRWDTRAQAVFPQFRVADPQLSQTLTLRDLVCACSGVPRRDYEIFFRGGSLSALDVVRSLGSFQFYTRLGEAFQYSNQMVASGGYLAAVAAGASPQEMLEGYARELHYRVLDPIGIRNTTLSFELVLARGNHATPHGQSFSGQYRPIPLDEERILLSVAPAGAHWSTAPDLARYLLTELARGVSPQGRRVVSAEGLEFTWQPQVKVDAQTSYGLGWFVGEYKGVRLIQHGGNTLGFTSLLAFLPDKGLGVVVLSNAQNANPFTQAVMHRVLELAFGQSAEYDARFRFALEAQAKATKEALEALTSSLDTPTLQPYLRRFRNPDLGELTLSLREGRLFVSIGSFTSQLLFYPKEGTYVMVDPPLAGQEFSLGRGPSGNPQVRLKDQPQDYPFDPL